MFAVLRARGANVLASLAPDEWRAARRLLIDAVLATDMAGHCALARELQARASPPRFDAASEADRALLVKALLHAADISNGVRPFRAALAMVGRVHAEFARQAAAERREGLPVSPHMEAAGLEERASMEVQFLDYVAGPLWARLAAAFPSLAPCLAQMRFVRRCFLAVAGGAAAAALKAAAAAAAAPAGPAGAAAAAPAGASAFAAQSRLGGKGRGGGGGKRGGGGGDAGAGILSPAEEDLVAEIAVAAALSGGGGGGGGSSGGGAAAAPQQQRRVSGAGPELAPTPEEEGGEPDGGAEQQQQQDGGEAEAEGEEDGLGPLSARWAAGLPERDPICGLTVCTRRAAAEAAEAAEAGGSGGAAAAAAAAPPASAGPPPAARARAVSFSEAGSLLRALRLVGRRRGGSGD